MHLNNEKLCLITEFGNGGFPFIFIFVLSPMCISCKYKHRGECEDKTGEELGGRMKGGRRTRWNFPRELLMISSPKSIFFFLLPMD